MFQSPGTKWMSRKSATLLKYNSGTANNVTITGQAIGSAPLSVVGAIGATANIFQVANSTAVVWAINSTASLVAGNSTVNTQANSSAVFFGTIGTTVGSLLSNTALTV